MLLSKRRRLSFIKTTYIRRNTALRCGSFRLRTSMYAPSSCPRAPCLACISAVVRFRRATFVIVPHRRQGLINLCTLPSAKPRPLCLARISAVLQTTYILRNTLSGCGNFQSRTSMYAPSSFPRPSRLARISVVLVVWTNSRHKNPSHHFAFRIFSRLEYGKS